MRTITIAPDVKVTLSIGASSEWVQTKLIVPPSLYAAIQAEGFAMDDFVVQLPAGTVGKAFERREVRR